MVITLGQYFWDIIAILITLHSLHDNFDTTIASFLEIYDKRNEQIQSILQSKNTKNISKQVTGRDAGNLAMTFRDKKPKRKANSNKKC